MFNPAAALAELGALDRLAAGDTAVHRYDPRAKLAVTLAFVIAVASFPPTAFAGLVPFALFPLVMAIAGGVPGRYLWSRILWVLPFALLLGIANPWLDRVPVVTVGGLAVTGGWLSLGSIILRVILTVSAALVLLATTGIHPLCRALNALGCPRVLTVQVLLLYRYLFVLVEQSARIRMARGLRLGQRPTLAEAGTLLGQLLLRAIDRAGRIHLAMRSRGFDGTFRLARELRWIRRDTLFLCSWLVIFIFLRAIDWSRLGGGIS